MRLSVLYGGVGLQHKPLRPAASFLILLGKNNAQNSLRRLIMLKRQEQFHRPLANVAGAPGSARILFKAMRHREMHHGVMHQPREDGADSIGIRAGAGALEANAAGDVVPKTI